MAARDMQGLRVVQPAWSCPYVKDQMSGRLKGVLQADQAHGCQTCGGIRLRDDPR